jgi:hypothetical protein
MSNISTLIVYATRGEIIYRDHSETPPCQGEFCHLGGQTYKVAEVHRFLKQGRPSQPESEVATFLRENGNENVNAQSITHFSDGQLYMDCVVVVLLSNPRDSGARLGIG